MGIHARADVVWWQSEFLVISFSSQDFIGRVMSLVDGYVQRLPVDTSDADLGAAALRGLSHDVGPLPRPDNRAKPRPRDAMDDLVDELGVTQRVFDKTGKHLQMTRHDREIWVNPYVYEKGHLVGGPDEHDEQLPLTVDAATLGRVVRRALTGGAAAAPAEAAGPAPVCRDSQTGAAAAPDSAAAVEPEVAVPVGDPVALAAFLRASGLWAGLPVESQDAHEAAVAAGGYPLNEGVSGYVADGEELSEGGVLDLLAELDPALAPHGLVLDAREVVEADQSYTVSINGLRCVVLPDADEPDWDAATMRPLHVVNQLLSQAGATVRVFVLYPGGNEGLAVLLDPRVPAAMRASGLFDDTALPVLAHTGP